MNTNVEKINKNQEQYKWPYLQKCKFICFLSLSIGLLALSACSVHKASFDCPNSKGMGCGSMIEVHEAIKNNEFPKESDKALKLKQTNSNISSSTSECKDCQNKKQNTNDLQGENSRTNSFANSVNTNSLVSRSSDKIMKIWFNGHFDEYNNFHDSQYIYTIVQPAQWLVSK